MNTPLYSRALQNARLTHQKSLPTLSSQTTLSPNMPRKNFTEPNPRQFPSIDPPSQYPPPAPPASRASNAPMIKLPGGEEISLSV